uniref:LRRCT domain-containing protein n=1 Tax=Glossina austeni TaxID=7395 RepID=A0A1A9UJ61_GLOAU
MFTSSLSSLIKISILFTLLGSWCCLSTRAEDILLKCDETDLLDSLFCTVSGFQVSHSQNVKIPNQTKANLKRFMKFYNSVLLYIPAKLFDVFSSLTNFDASYTEIEDIPRNTFSSANSLVTLNLSNNKLEKITTSAFVGAHNLMRLDLSYNCLHTLTNLTFTGLNELSRVVLANNRLKVLPKDLFAENSYLDEVNLANNLLEFIEPEVFNHLDNIREVNLTNNLLRMLDPNTFASSYALEVLYVSNNQLIDFHLANKSVSKTLNLSHNKLTSLLINGTRSIYAGHNLINEVKVLNGRELVALWLQNNQIKDITNITTALTNLYELDLGFNPVGTPNISTYQRLEHMTELYLRATGIHYLTFGMFSKLKSLSVLDLSYNNLTELNLEIFVPSNDNMKYFYVDANNLTEIQGKYTFASAFPFLQQLGISRNRFNCSYLHWLLISPQLMETTQLHIETDDSDEEVTHIRDVTCVSHVREDLKRVEHDLYHSDELKKILQQSLETMSLHAQQMQSYLLVLKISLVVLVCVICIVGWHYGRILRAKYQVRRGGAIVYHSNATMSTQMEQ